MAWFTAVSFAILPIPLSIKWAGSTGLILTILLKPVASKNILIDSMLIEAFEAEKKEVAQKAKLKTKRMSVLAG